MVVTQFSDISAPGSRCLLVDKNENPLGRYGLGGALANCKQDCRKSQQLVAVRTQIVYTCDQAYKGYSRKLIIEEIMADYFLMDK